jgi:dCMP deaminase
MALTASTRSESLNTKVGCAIENHDGRIIATGFNGLKDKCKINLKKYTREERRDFFIHAESNALSLVKKGDAKTIYITHSPCINCAQNIIAHGIDTVYYITEYEHELKFKELFNMYDVKYYQTSFEQLLKIKEQTYNMFR